MIYVAAKKKLNYMGRLLTLLRSARAITSSE